MIQTTEKGLVLSLRVIPNSSKNCIMKENEGIKIKITASPVDNKANQALTEFLSKFLGVPKSNIEILKGNTSKDKKVLIKVSDNKKQTEIIEMITKNIL